MGISLPPPINFNTATCAASLKVSVNVLGGSVSWASFDGTELCSFACAMQGPASIAPESATARIACLSIYELRPYRISILVQPCNILHGHARGLAGLRMILYGYGLSSASYRVRIALALK